MGEIRIVGPGKTHGYPYPVCKKIKSPPTSDILGIKSESVSQLFLLNARGVLQFTKGGPYLEPKL